MASATFSERDLMKSQTLTVTIKRGYAHRSLLWIGLHMISLGTRVAGFGSVAIEKETT